MREVSLRLLALHSSYTYVHTDSVHSGFLGAFNVASLCVVPLVWSACPCLDDADTGSLPRGQLMSSSKKCERRVAQTLMIVLLQPPLLLTMAIDIVTFTLRLLIDIMPYHHPFIFRGPSHALTTGDP